MRPIQLTTLVLLVNIVASEDVRSKRSEARSECGCACRSYTIHVCRFSFSHACNHNQVCDERPVAKESEVRVSECQRCVAHTQDFVRLRRIRHCFPVESEICVPVHPRRCLTALDCSTVLNRRCYHETSTHLQYCTNKPLKNCRRKRQCLPTKRQKCKRIKKNQCVLVPRHFRAAQRAFRCEQFEPRKPDRPCPEQNKVIKALEIRQNEAKNGYFEEYGDYNDYNEERSGADHRRYRGNKIVEKRKRDKGDLNDYNELELSTERFYDPRELAGIDYFVSDIDNEDDFPKFNDDENNNEEEEDNVEDEGFPDFGFPSNRRLDDGEDDVQPDVHARVRPRARPRVRPRARPRVRPRARPRVRPRIRRPRPRPASQLILNNNIQGYGNVDERFRVWEELYDPEDLANVDYYVEHETHLPVNQVNTIVKEKPIKEIEQQVQRPQVKGEVRHYQEVQDEQGVPLQQGEPRPRHQQRVRAPEKDEKEEMLVEKRIDKDEGEDDPELFDFAELEDIEYFDETDNNEDEIYLTIENEYVAFNDANEMSHSTEATNDNEFERRSGLAKTLKKENAIIDKEGKRRRSEETKENESDKVDYTVNYFAPNKENGSRNKDTRMNKRRRRLLHGNSDKRRKMMTADNNDRQNEDNKNGEKEDEDNSGNNKSEERSFYGDFFGMKLSNHSDFKAVKEMLIHAPDN